MDREVEAEENEPNFSISFVSSMLRVGSAGHRNEVKKRVRVVVDLAFDERELCRYVREAEYCKRILNGKNKDALEKNGLLKKHLRNESSSAASSSALHRKDTLNAI